MGNVSLEAALRPQKLQGLARMTREIRSKSFSWAELVLESSL